jgi:hypothetical protein
MQCRLYLGAAFAALAALLLFSLANPYEFLELDDFGYIIDNRHLDRFTWQTVVWAFTQFHEANWHPLTMLSLALDRKLWGLDPFGFHLTNAILHSGTVFISCLVFAEVLRQTALRDDTAPAARGGDLSGPVVMGSIASALFFGLHPLRVESVVWISERKDVLALFFLVAAIWCYLRYAAQRRLRLDEGAGSFGSYRLVLLFAVLATLSKPVAVSLPVLLLILDWYPLGRLHGVRALILLVREKIPLLLCSAVGMIMTVFAQQEPIALSATLTLPSKLLVAGKALLWYPWRTLWPADLAPLHPHPGNVAGFALGEYLGYVAIVVLICWFLVKMGRQQRALPAVGLFSVIALLPMLGILHVGRQWVADRYSYLPGLALALLWGGGGVWLLTALRRRGQHLGALLVAAVALGHLVACIVVTLRYIPCWRTTETIATRQIEIYPRQIGVVYFARAKYRNERGNYRAALADVDEALAVLLRKRMPEKYLPVSQLRAEILRSLGRLPEALVALEWGLRASSEPATPEALALRDALAAQIAAERRQTGSRPQ